METITRYRASDGSEPQAHTPEPDVTVYRCGQCGAIRIRDDKDAPKTIPCPFCNPSAIARKLETVLDTVAWRTLPGDRTCRVRSSDGEHFAFRTGNTERPACRRVEAAGEPYRSFTETLRTSDWRYRSVMVEHDGLAITVSTAGIFLVPSEECSNGAAGALESPAANLTVRDLAQVVIDAFLEE